jgi:4-amino-4-deoxy-L-arabinose transferase-like glycosyltransferase
MKPFLIRILNSLDVCSTLSPAERNAEKYAPLIFLIGILLLCYLPFLNKAYSIDDPLFIWSAQHIQVDPSDPYGFNVIWYRREMPMSFVTKNPPIACYYIAAASFLFGWEEPVIHAAFLLPAIAVAVGTFLFAKRYCKHPLVASLAGILTPVFLVSSLTVMSDVMMLAFWIFAVYFWIKGLDNKSPAALVLAGLLISCAALTKYFGIMLIPLLFFYTLYRDRRFGYQLVFFLLPIFILAAYHWRTESLYGRGLLFDATEYAMDRNSLLGNFKISKIFVNFAFIGGCLASFLFFATALWSRKTILASLMITTIGVFILSNIIILFAFPLPTNTINHVLFSIQFCLWTMVGISSIALALRDFYYHREADTLLLFLWMIGTFIFSGFINWTINGRSILPMIVPTGILITRALEHQLPLKKSQKRYPWLVPLVLSAILSISVTWADCSFANTARSAAESICKKYSNPKKDIWFQGHWGYQYYMEQHGARSIDVSHLQFKPGDIIADPTINTNVRSIPQSWVTIGDTLQISSPKYAVTMDPRLGAGFYADIFGLVPFTFGLVEPEIFIIYNFIGFRESNQ